MALFLSQLILLPILAVFTWMYVRLRPKETSTVWFDLIVITVAVLCSAAGLLWTDSIEVGHASPIWKPILSIITTFHIFPVVLFIGWLIRRQRFN